MTSNNPWITCTRHGQQPVALREALTHDPAPNVHLCAVCDSQARPSDDGNSRLLITTSRVSVRKYLTGVWLRVKGDLREVSAQGGFGMSS